MFYDFSCPYRRLAVSLEAWLRGAGATPRAIGQRAVEIVIAVAAMEDVPVAAS